MKFDKLNKLSIIEDKEIGGLKMFKKETTSFCVPGYGKCSPPSLLGLSEFQAYYDILPSVSCTDLLR